MKILYLTNIPSPYMVDFLNELGKRSELTAVFERGGSGVRDRSWDNYSFETFKGIILRGKNIRVTEELDDQAICPQVIRYIDRKKYDAIVVANPCTPTGIIAIAYMKMMRIPYAIQSEGGFPKDGRGAKEKLKWLVMKNAALYFSTAKVGDDYFLQYGADATRIRRYPFTSLYDAEVRKERVTKEEKIAVKRKLGITYDKVVLSVGRFIPVKGFDVFIKACSGFDDSVGIYIVGGEATDEYLRLKEELGMTNLHFVGHVDKATIKSYYTAADVFALNSRGDTWGLVINEAMSYGLPVVSSDKCYAALALIENDVNGYVVEVDSIAAFRDRIRFLLENDDLANQMGDNNIKKMQEYTLEKMAETEINVLREMCEDAVVERK